MTTELVTLPEEWIALLRAVVGVKDARIRELEKDIAILKAQMADLERLTERIR
jgi:hypothetical protein